MANYPQGIVFSVSTGVILELVGEAPINTFSSKDIGFGYIRQYGAAAYVGVLDQYVQYQILYHLFSQELLLFMWMLLMYYLPKRQYLYYNGRNKTISGVYEYRRC
jgi:hypothetical protein